MPLVITVAEGDDFYVGENRWVVTHVDGPREFRVSGPTGIYAVGPDDWVPISSQASIKSGCASRSGKNVRVAFMAPGILIARGVVMRRNGVASPLS